MIRSVFAGDIVYNLLPALYAEVYIEIRHGYALGVKETLEYQVIFYGIRIRYAHGICRKAACAAAASGAYEYAVFMGKVYEVPHYQEIVHEAHLGYHVYLVFKPVLHLTRGVRHFSIKALMAYLCKVFEVSKTAGRGKAGQVLFAEFYLYAALVRYFFCSLKRLRIVWQHGLEFVFRLEIKLIGGHLHAVSVGDHTVCLYAKQDVLAFGVLLFDVMYIVGCDVFYVKLLRELYKLWKHLQLLRYAVVLYLYVEVLAEYPL